MAQTSGPVADGEFTGSIVVQGGATIDIGEGGVFTYLINGSGPLELVLVDGTMTGTWSLNAVQSASGEIAGAGALVTNGTVSGSGDIGGPPGNYAMTGSITSVNTASVAGQTSTNTETEQINYPITELIVLCDSIHGRWDLKAQEAFTAAGFDSFVRGYFSASTGVDATEQAQEVEDLLEEVARWAGDAATIEEGDRSLMIGRGLSLLSQAQGLQAELAAPSPCPPDPTFVTELTLAAQDVLNTLIGRFPGIVSEYVVVLALGSGAIGAGSPVPSAAAELQATMEADVQARFESEVTDGQFGPDYVGVLRTALMLGMDSLVFEGSSNSITDLLLVATGSSS